MTALTCSVLAGEEEVSRGSSKEAWQRRRGLVRKALTNLAGLQQLRELVLVHLVALAARSTGDANGYREGEW